MPQQAIEQLIRELNAAWSHGRVDDLHRFFAPDVILVPPGGRGRVRGREAMVESYRQFVEQATTRDFEVTGLDVDVVETTAVARMRYRIRYELAGEDLDESGQEILVLVRQEAARWRIVWRTQIPDL